MQMNGRIPKEANRSSIVVKNSSVHGQGVFAARDILAAEVIIDWDECSEVLTERDIEKLSFEERKRVSFLDGQHILFKPPACWVNHSCDANARGRNRQDVAIRAIKAGEEITVDYVVEKVPGLNLRCTCGLSNCRGFLVVPTPENTHLEQIPGKMELLAGINGAREQARVRRWVPAEDARKLLKP